MPDPLHWFCLLFVFDGFALYQLLQYTLNILLQYFNNAPQGAPGTRCILKPNFIVHLSRGVWWRGTAFVFFLTNYDKKSHLTSDRRAYFCIKLSLSSVYVYMHTFVHVWGRERHSEKRSCQHASLSLSPVLSNSPRLCFLSRGAEQRGVRKALFPSLSFIFHHSWVGDVKQAIAEPLYDTRQRFHPSNRVSDTSITPVTV